MNKFLLWFFLLPCTLQAQISWDKKSDFPGDARSAAVSFVVNDKAYVGLGNDDSGYPLDFWEYDAATSTWASIADFPGVGRTDAVAFAINGIGYVATGEGEAGDLSDVWAYDPATDTWSQKNNFNGGARQAAVTFSVDAQVFVATGRTSSTYFRDCWEYHPATDSWSQRASLPAGQERSEALAFSFSGQGYIGGGFWFTGTSTLIQNNLYVYDPTENVWAEKEFAHISLSRQNGVAFVVKDRIFFGLGQSRGDFYEYDPVNNSFTSETDFGPVNQDNRDDAVTFVIGDRAYVGLGDYQIEIFNNQKQNDLWQA